MTDQFLIVLCILPLLTYSVPIETQESSAPLNLADIQLDDEVSDDQSRTKRSGFDIGAVKQNLFSSLSSASAGVVGGLSSSSGKAFSSSSGSGHSDGGSYDSYGPPQSNAHGFDGGDLKRNILNTLFQAVKAISGGIVGIKGQLIKGSGYLVSAKGKLIASSGDQVSSQGHKITHSATLVPAGPSGSGKAQLFSLSSSLSGSSSGSSSGDHGSSGGSGDFLGSLTKLSGASSGALSSKGTDNDNHAFTSYDSHGTQGGSYEAPVNTNFNVHTSYVEPSYVPHQSYGAPVSGHSSNYASVH
uniref:CSON012360 protein n=1 Tax=Culicoides sonorensis TaxID=179676 RepID=A0A336M9I1_CULSO